MYICNNCGAVFESTVSIHEYHDKIDNQIEEYHGCPYCKSDDICEAVQCSMCGEYVAYDYIILKDGTIACSDCYTTY